VPQPSDDPDDPLVRTVYPEVLTSARTDCSSELAQMEKRAQLLVALDDGCFDWSGEDDIYND
jgi:hypothetical protein